MFMRLRGRKCMERKSICKGKGDKGGITHSENSDEFIMDKRRK